MYAALWRVLPGPIWLKIVWLVVIVAAVATACIFWIFPWLAHTFFDVDATVGDGT